VLAATFRFTGAQIQEVARAARDRVSVAGTAAPALDDYHACARALGTRKLAALSRCISPTQTWDALVLPPEPYAQLRELCGRVRQRMTVLEEWGFGRRMTRGLLALFSGASGTGKTFAAEILSGSLGLDLYQPDISCIVSKYIGDTERNLSRIFQEAEESSALLFFDEADALFGKRTEVRDSHDRYAKIEVNFLLQRAERHDGVIILSTNMPRSIDDAFLRRLHFSIEFPFPDERLPLRLWRAMFPPSAPLGPGVDFERLAQRFPVTGGTIRNASLAAAFLAADDGRVITMSLLLKALRRE
jgi:SpoVK/Ycf46/Vps4 family AAA+-type ATPase